MLAASPPNIEGARETARRTIRDGNGASEVIKRLRALFGKKDPALEPVDLNEATREVIALSLGKLQANRVVLRGTELADDLPNVMATVCSLARPAEPHSERLGRDELHRRPSSRHVGED